MPESPSDVPAGFSDRGSPLVADQLRRVAQLLRDAEHLNPDARATLAGVVEELAEAMRTTPISQPEIDHLTGDTARLLQALHDRHEEGALASARERVQRAVVKAEARAPHLADLVRRLLDTLISLGI